MNKQQLEHPRTVEAIGDIGHAMALLREVEAALEEALAWDDETFEAIADDMDGGDGLHLRACLEHVLYAIILSGSIDAATTPVVAEAANLRVLVARAG